MFNIIITGATSMVGVSIIQEALKREDIGEILAVIRPGSERKERIAVDNRIRMLEVSFDNYDKLKEYVIKNDKVGYYDIIYHLAWSRTPTYSESYSDMLLKCDSIKGVLSAANVAEEIGCRKFVYCGGQAEYGIVETDLISPNTTCNPVRADGVAHYAAGKMASILCKQFNIPFIWVRIFSVYGIYDRPNSMISSTIKKMKNNEACDFTKAEQIWDYIYADDLGEGILLAGIKNMDDKIYCIGSGDYKPLKEYIEIIRDVVNPNCAINFGTVPYPENPVMRLCPDISDIVRDTGWKPKTSFREGIKKILDYEKAKNLNRII